MSGLWEMEVQQRVVNSGWVMENWFSAANHIILSIKKT